MNITSSTPFRHGLAVQTIETHGQLVDYLIERTGRRIALFDAGVTFDEMELIAGAITEARELEDSLGGMLVKVGEHEEEIEELKKDHKEEIEGLKDELDVSEKCLKESREESDKYFKELMDLKAEGKIAAPPELVATLTQRVKDLEGNLKTADEVYADSIAKLKAQVDELGNQAQCLILERDALTAENSELKKDLKQAVQNSFDSCEDLASQLQATRETANALRLLTERQQYKLEQQAELIRQMENDFVVLPRCEMPVEITSVDQL